ncbi:MAG: cyanophycin synthetase, partial [Planctomycetota bacterium]
DAPPTPAVAVITGFAPNHLDWHGSLEHYRESKQSLIVGADRVVLGPTAAEWPAPLDTATITEPADLQLQTPGTHNRLNAALALAAAASFGLATPSDALANFKGLPHRLERLAVRTANNIALFNDSKSTTPEATSLALAALAEDGFGRVHLIAGGADKGVDLRPMFANATNIASVHAIGATADAIRQIRLESHAAGTLEAAVAEIARYYTQPGDAVLLSPGCASWDQFTNYEQRGEHFAQLCARHWA